MSGKSRAQLLAEEEEIPPPVALLNPATPRYSYALNQRVEDLCHLGCSNEELAGFLNVDPSTVQRWLVESKPFRNAVARGREIGQSRVARALHSRAVGYSHPETKVIVVQGKVEKVEITKHYPPSETAAALYLANRAKDKWRSREASGSGVVDWAGIVMASLGEAKPTTPGDDAAPVQAVVIEGEKSG